MVPSWSALHRPYFGADGCVSSHVIYFLTTVCINSRTSVPSVCVRGYHHHPHRRPSKGWFAMGVHFANTSLTKYDDQFFNVSPFLAEAILQFDEVCGISWTCCLTMPRKQTSSGSSLSMACTTMFIKLSQQILDIRVLKCAT